MTNESTGRWAFVVAGAGALILGIAFVWQAGRADLPEVGSLLDSDAQPTAWVPFSATSRVVADAGLVTPGRFHRDRHGSTRREVLDGDGAVRLVDIVNLAEGTFYVRSETGRWSVQRIEPLPATYYSPTVSGPHQIVLGHKVEGLTVLREKTAEGAVLLRAPALNGFAVIEEHPDDGVRIEYSEIRVGEQDPRLFRPPDGADVKPLPWPHDGSLRR